MRSAEGSTYKAKDGKKWVARLRYTDKDGLRREKKRLCLTYKAASLKVAELKQEVDFDKKDRRTFNQLDVYYRKTYVHEAKFVSGQKVSGFRQSLDAVNHYLNAALAYFGNRPLDEITFADLQKFKAMIMERPTVHDRQRSVSDTNQFLKRLRRLFTVAVEQGWLAVNPFKRGGSLITESFEVQRTRVLSAAEETGLLAQCKGKRLHLKPLLVFAIETACRKNEILSLKWEAVNFERRFITIEATTTKTLKKRLVPISARLLEILEQQWKNSRRRTSDLVFTTGDCKRAFLGAIAATGLRDVHFHDLRHTAITRMLEKGISPPLVMKISGHSQMKTFLRYVNQTESSIYEIAMRLDAAA